MRMEPDRKIRNLGIVAHVDAGKTTLSEAILLRCGAIPAAGRVDDGETTMDYLREEQRRGITIRSAAASFGWKGLRINLVDTPGHVDFGLEVERSLRVLDGVIAVFCGVRGVEPRSLAVWREADSFHLPRLAFANKLDVPGADFSRLIAQMRDNFPQTIVPVMWPMIGHEGLEGWVDLISWQASRLRGSEMLALPEVPHAWADAAFPWRENLRDAASLFSDALTELLLDGAEPSPRDLREGLRAGCRAGKLVPVCAGSALRSLGTDLLLDAVGHYLPPPSVPETYRGHPGLGLLVRSRQLESGGHIALVRCWEGAFEPGQAVRRGGGGAGRITGIWSVFAQELLPQKRLMAGEIAAVELEGDWRAGDSLLAGEPDVVFETKERRQAVLEVLLEPCDASDMPVLEAALSRMIREDGALQLDRDLATGALRLQGVGELQLDVVLTRLHDESGCSFRSRPPRVVKRERISCASGRCEGRLELDGAVIDAWCEVAPAEGGKNVVECILDVPNEALETVLHAAVEEVCQVGVSGAGSLGGTCWHLGCSIAAPEPRRVLHLAKRCLDHLCREALEKAGAHTEEPLFRLVVNAPHEAVGNVLRELQARGAKVQEIQALTGGSTIMAKSLLSSLLGLSTLLLSISKGQAESTLESLGWVDASEPLQQTPVTETPSSNDI